MYKVPHSSVANWASVGDLRYPSSIDMICPYCGRQVNFSVPHWQDAKAIHALYASSRCSGCGEKVSFLWLSEEEVKDRKEIKHYELYIHPTPELIRRPIDSVDEFFSDALIRAYTAAINTYNTRLWVPSAASCRRALEGIAKDLLPEDKQERKLFQLLQELPNHVDLDKPLLDLADSLREGGNLAAHFDTEKEPDQDTVTMMLDLLDYIIEYLYILPSRIEKLRKKLD